MRRLRAALSMCALVLCTGCAVVMPNTAAAIAPATFDDFWLAAAADAEQWIQILTLLIGL